MTRSYRQNSRGQEDTKTEINLFHIVTIFSSLV